MKTFIVTIIKLYVPIKSWKQLGFTANEVYWNVREEYPVSEYGYDLRIDVAEILS